MIRPDQIPPEALKAASTVIFKMREDGDFSSADIARAAAEALLAAWPGMQHKPYWDFRTNEKHTELILPVPQKEKGGQ